MNKILNLRIYTPNQLFLEEVITKISVYGKEGFYTILPNHIDYISSFDDGVLVFEKEDKDNAANAETDIIDDIEISLDDLEATLKDSDFSDFDDFLDEEAAADASFLNGGGE
jgi:hypothetical protein